MTSAWFMMEVIIGPSIVEVINNNIIILLLYYYYSGHKMSGKSLLRQFEIIFESLE